MAKNIKHGPVLTQDCGAKLGDPVRLCDLSQMAKEESRDTLAMGQSSTGSYCPEDVAAARSTGARSWANAAMARLIAATSSAVEPPAGSR